ncbi:uncharacterized protein LOC125492634 [Beta vulgaris subsp. vulgaris]|uniref:uncharacterized protein LOC125492634 n=1 Tax=Beta vulgaris subsp. vulgaris TaxID=3555 RepID=UPI00254983ED|nr:uncharacterized protein LOC125492634 [Beta vulgaris subsp. vulgaris]
MSTFMKAKGHASSELIHSFPIREIHFDWKSRSPNLDCGVFMLYHCCLYNGKRFKSAHLHKARERKLYRAEICASLVLSDLNIIRAPLLISLENFNKDRQSIVVSVVQHEIEEEENKKQGKRKEKKIDCDMTIKQS